MARPRHARRTSASTVIPVAVAIVAIAALAVVFYVRSGRSTATSPADEASASPPASSTGSSEPAASNRSEPAASGTASGSAAPALQACRDQVAAQDAVIAAAKTGIGHWSEHVQAQTDANDGKITHDQMQAIFTRTRLNGPVDVNRYDQARARAADDEGSCPSPHKTGDAASTTQAAACRARLDAQQPVLTAGADGMADWKAHLAAMRRSRMSHVPDAQQVWIDTWRAAPPHINAFDRAADHYRNAPTC